VGQQSIGRKPRPYRSELRRRQARETHERILAAAGELFAQDGYARTTLARIASAAGVSPETVQGHGPKSRVLIDALGYASFGTVEQDQNVLELDVGQQFQAIDDMDAAVDFLVEEQTAIHARSARLFRALRGGADTDAELAEHLVELHAGIALQTQRVMTVARERGWLRDDVDFEELVEWAVLLSGVEGYDRMVLRDGWSEADYRRYLRASLDALVLRRRTRKRR
jgi:AcrR family transcriptional regulator